MYNTTCSHVTNSSITPNMTMGIFKDFNSQVYKIYTEKYHQGEIYFLINIFTVNGHDRNTLANLAAEY